jgi:8-oxo-dGTP diphosphatase
MENKNPFRGLILFFVAVLMTIFIYPVGFAYSVILTFFKSGYKALDNYLFQCAIAQDQHGNTFLAKLFNDTLIKTGGYKFGHPDRTISHVIGMNKRSNTLTLLGRCIEKILDTIDTDHSEKSIEY